MRKIQKTFSLEPMTSRMPSVWPAYKDNTLYYFDNASLKKRDYKFPSNYGMIPMRISFLSAVTEDNKVEYSLDCSDDAITISFERLSNWYYFFKEYYHLLNDYGHCNRTYSSATEYYKYESGERYANQMIYGTDEQTYIDLDAEFANMGGSVDVSASGSTDVGFYKWICDNIVPSYYISKDYTEYWKRTKLYYPDVIKWMAWFSVRLGYEDNEDVHIYSAATYDKGKLIEKEHWNCKDSAVTDCCDCEEYFNRGGKREFERMKDWYDGLQDNIMAMNDIISSNTECFIPTMDDKILLHNSLDDLGQYSIFSKEYEIGIDYRTASYGDTENTHGGTVVERSGNTMILNDGNDGFCFSRYYMDKVYDENAWSDYTNKYMNDSMCPICGYYGHIDDTCPNCGYSGEDIIRNKNEFVANGYRYYAYDNDNVMYTGNTPQAVKDSMSSAYTYDLIETDAILIDGVLYDIQKSEYGEYDITNQYISGKTFFVYRETDTSTPYTLINGKKVYAEWYPYPNPEFDNQPCYYFTFFRTNTRNKGVDCGKVDNSFNITNYRPFGRKANDDDSIDYISYMGQIFEVDGDYLEINRGTEEEENMVEYPRVSGYAYSNTNQLMYYISIKEGEEETLRPAVVDADMLLEIPNSKVEDGKIIIGLNYEPDIYNAYELSGHTVSRLTDLRAFNLLVDDIGNEVDGKYNPHKKTIYNHQPNENEELELLYQVGNTSQINRISGVTVEDVDNFTTYDNNTKNYFIGNIITDMVFYYKDKDGNAVEDTITEWDGSSLEAIHTAQEARKPLENTVLFDGEDIYCDVTYYIGATLSRKKGEPFKLAYTDEPQYNYGVEYKETVKFVKEKREYYLKKIKGKQIPTIFNVPSSHSISYPIYVYKLEQEMTIVDYDDYDTNIESPLATFKTEINLINDDLTSNFTKFNDMDRYNNIHVAPTFKQEYMLGISSLENIDSDIYIERGINAAFEKHLKLGEVTSLEALEQYSNGYFKIINN